MSIEAMKKMVEAIEADLTLFNIPATSKMLEALSAGRQAIEEAENQKPVAWSVLDKRTGKHWYTNESKYTAQHYANEYSHNEPDGSPSMVVKPLYTHPPKREWVGLTNENKLAMELGVQQTAFKVNRLTAFFDGLNIGFNLADKKLKELNT
jgi:hypothetical protein